VVDDVVDVVALTRERGHWASVSLLPLSEGNEDLARSRMPVSLSTPGAPGYRHRQCSHS